MQLNRRQALSAFSSSLFSSSLGATGAFAASGADSDRKAVAFLGTVVRRHSHAQHILDRLTAGYNWAGRWQKPRVDVASVYVDQFPDDDLARPRIAKHDLRRFPSIADTLTLGGDELAVDGVVIVAEHGDYPKNDRGQKLYPRYDWFKQVVEVFERSGRAVPVFNDKHLSTDWDQCVEMVADSERLGFPLLAGSSLPVTRRLPAVDMPYNADLKESVCVAYGGVDSYDIHALETAQCMSERRRGGEAGVKSVHALRGPDVWRALDADDREITRKLVVAALTRSHNLPVQGGYPTDPVSYQWAKRTLKNPTAYLIEHRDGFRTTMLLTDIGDFNYAGYLESGEIVSCQMYLPMPARGATTADFFSPLTRHVEDLVLNANANYPVERTLLCSGIVIAGVRSLWQGERLLKTPELKVEYRGPKQSTFWRV